MSAIEGGGAPQVTLEEKSRALRGGPTALSAARAGESAVNIGGTYCKGLCAGRRPGSDGDMPHAGASREVRGRSGYGHFGYAILGANSSTLVHFLSGASFRPP